MCKSWQSYANVAGRDVFFSLVYVRAVTVSYFPYIIIVPKRVHDYDIIKISIEIEKIIINNAKSQIHP